VARGAGGGDNVRGSEADVSTRTRGGRMGAAAVALTRRDLPVFPLFEPDPDAPRGEKPDGTPTGGCACQDSACESAGKHPRIGGGFKHATTDAEQVAYWWRRWPTANIGIATGCTLPTGGFLAVLDIDPRNNGDASLDTLEAEHGELPDTVQVNTGGGGLHFYFSTAEPIPGGKVAEGIDLKAAGGYVVAPPSLHPSGRLYEVAIGEGAMGTLSFVALPEWVCLAAHPSGTTDRPRMEPSEVVTLLRGVPEGGPPMGRDDAATKLIGHWLGKRLPVDEVELLALDWNRKNRPPLPDKVLLDKVRRFSEQDAAKAASHADSERCADTVAAEDRTGAPPTLSLRNLAEILNDPDAMKAPEAVVPRLAWSGRVTLLAGREKLGKSTLASAGAAAASYGTRFLGEPCKAGPVLWVGLEEHPGDTAPRFLTFGADPAHIYILDRLEKPFADLAAAVQQTGAVLVVVDTLSRFAESLVDDPYSSTKWVPVMAGLTRVARDTGAAFLLLHHARKSDGEYRDSTAIGAGVDAVLTLHPGEEATVRKLEGKGRWSIQNCAVRLDGSCYTLAAGELSMDARVLLYVENDPGCSKRQVREGVTGKATLIDSAVSRLLDRGALVDRGGEAGSALYVGSRDAFRDAPAASPENQEDTQQDAASGRASEPGCVPNANHRVSDRDAPPTADDGAGELRLIYESPRPTAKPATEVVEL
jgi:hypothetical protein